MLTDREEMSNLYKRPSVDASYLVLVHLAKQFQRRFLEIDQSETKNCLWRPCLFTDRDKMSNHYRGRPIDASYQDSVHLAKRFQGRRIFRNQPIRNKSHLLWPTLLMDRYEMSNLYRGPSIDASYQV